MCGPREVPGRAGGGPEAARAAGGWEPAAEETGGGGAELRWSRAPVELEVEECRWGLIGKNKKVQGLHYKIKFTTDLGLN